MAPTSELAMSSRADRAEALQALSSSSLFGILSRDTLQELLAASSLRPLPKGSALFLQGQTETTLYLVVRGEISMDAFSPTGFTLSHLVASSSEVFGEIALLDPG